MLGLAIIGTNVWAGPVNLTTAENFYIYQDLNNKIQLKQVDPNNFQNYAIQKVQQKSEGYVMTEINRAKVITDIEKIYQNFVLLKLNLIQKNAIDTYKSEFLKQQTEESVQSQIRFYQTEQGKAVLSKQIKKQNFMQNLSKEIPVLISQQDDFQAQIKAVLVNGESQ